MRRHDADFLRAAHRTDKRFMRHKRMPELNIGALVVSFLGLAGNLKATAHMRGRSMHRTIHHFVQP